MANTNVVVIQGNLTKDPELKRLDSGKTVCKIRLAHNTRRKVGDEWVDKPNYFNVTAWEHQADYAGKHLKKGTLVYVEGHLEHQQWEAKDGTKREAVAIVAEDINHFRFPEARADEPVLAEANGLPF